MSVLALAPAQAAAQTAMVDGGVYGAASLPQGQRADFTYVVAAGAPRIEIEVCVVNQAGCAGDADLHVRFNAVANTAPPYTGNDCNSTTLGNVETCVINNPAAGTWHITVYGFGNVTNYTLRVRRYNSFTLTYEQATGSGTIAAWGSRRAWPLNCVFNRGRVSGTCSTLYPASGGLIGIQVTPAAGSSFGSFINNCAHIVGQPAEIANVDTFRLTATCRAEIFEDVRTATSGVADADLIGYLESHRRYRITVPANAVELRMVLGGGAATGNPDLYAAFNNPAVGFFSGGTTVSNLTPGVAGTLVVPTPLAGDWYYAVYATAAYDHVDVTGGVTTFVATPPSRRRNATAGDEASVTDTATITIAGYNAAAIAWTATHRAAATWNTFTGGSAGTGAGMVRWTRTPGARPPGTHIDTITIVAGGVTHRVVDSLVVAPLTLPTATLTGALLGGAPLTAGQVAALDVNANGSFDVGDLLAYLVANGITVSAGTMERIMGRVR